MASIWREAHPSQVDAEQLKELAWISSQEQTCPAEPAWRAGSQQTGSALCFIAPNGPSTTALYRGCNPWGSPVLEA